jgi:hypothetical protein
MMLTFWEWLGQGYEFGFVQELHRLLREMRGDEGWSWGGACKVVCTTH